MVKLFAVNIPEEPESEPMLHAALTEAHAASIVERLHKEIDQNYPNFGECMKQAIHIAEWVGSSRLHKKSLSTNWWVHTTFNKDQE